MSNFSRIFATGLLFAAVTTVKASDDLPDWVIQATKAAVPAYEAKVPGAYLLRETSITVDPKGTITTTLRTVYKVLTLEGRQEAAGSQFYLRGTSKVRTLKAWILSPSGELLKLGKEQEFDRAYLSGNFYDDMRIRGIDARTKADPGSIFAVEAVLEQPALFNQFDWYFQYRLPTRVSRFSLTLPDGWRTQSTTFNHTPIEPTIENSSSSWVAQDLPFVEAEPSSPSLSSVVPRLAVSFFPPPGTSFQGASFANWQQVSAWITQGSSAQAEPTDDIKAKARELTANSANEFERIRTIARFVQNTRYVSVQLGEGTGGGYRPRPAADVLEKDYGDCKDKVTLMRALLKAAGIPSYMVLVSANDRSYVREEWPSPHQFNHAIIAIGTTITPGVNPVVEPPSLGRLLLFDPTSGSTPLGDLPINEQGSFGLIAAGEQGTLLRLPFRPATASSTERQIQAALDERGALTAKVTDQIVGQHASFERAILNSRGPAEFQKTIERWIAISATGAHISKIEQRDDFANNRFYVLAEFETPLYGQLRGNRLMVFKPAIVSRRQSIFLTELKRSQPVLLNPNTYRETAHFKLPANFKVDELPDAQNLETPFGHYSVTYEVKGGELIFNRSLEIRAVMVPVADYQSLRKFYERIVNIEQTPVVLAHE